MKMKRLKGFTLIECIIALFILGISSLLLVQAYGQLMRVTVSSNSENISISKQMDEAERRDHTNADKITATAQKNFVVQSVQIGSGTEKDITAWNSQNNSGHAYTAAEYTFQVDSYQIKGRTVMGNVSSGGTDADTMRYIYFE